MRVVTFVATKKLLHHALILRAACDIPWLRELFDLHTLGCRVLLGFGLLVCGVCAEPCPVAGGTHEEGQVGDVICVTGGHQARLDPGNDRLPCNVRQPR